MKIGYARVSTDDQKLDLQTRALKAEGCDEILKDQASGTQAKRPGLDKALAKIGAGDVLVVWRLDRLGRSLPHLIDTLRAIEAKGAGFKSLSEGIDTTTAGGRFVFHLFGALAEFERALIVERTQAGLAAAKAKGTRLGRKPKLTPQQARHARKLMEGGESASVVAGSLGVDRSTLYRTLGKLHLA